MLRFLRIAHLAVIDTVEVEFDAGFNVLTGETGAGKSILVEAVGLLLGGRSSTDLVRTGEDAATVEAVFETAGGDVLVRREVTAQGRSRAFVNGTLVTAGALKDLATGLVELHGQHEHQTLVDPSKHVGVLDAYGQLGPLLPPTRAAFDAMCAARDELARFRAALSERDARRELLAFQLAELDPAALGREPGEDEELASLRLVLTSAERIQRLCAESYASLYESDGAILAGLGHVWRRVAELALVDRQFEPYLAARDGIKSQLEDLADLLRRYAEGIEASPERLQQVEERLALLDRLKRKYGPSLDDVVSRRDSLRRELADLDHGVERLAELEARHVERRTAYVAAAGALSDARRRAAQEFAPELEATLSELAMAQTRVDVRFAEQPAAETAWTAEGFDTLEFYISPNVGEDLRPLARIVSGGELSRIMLAIKTLTFRARLSSGRAAGSSRREAGEADVAPGLVFDEVDAGIGGRVADVVGRRLHALGSAFQVLCITHLPQIAAYATTHFQVEKRIENGRTHTAVVRLGADGRVQELARMLGGETISAGLEASAREMLMRRAKGESERAKDGKSQGRRKKGGPVSLS